MAPNSTPNQTQSATSLMPAFSWQSQIFGKSGYDAVTKVLLQEISKREMSVSFLPLSFQKDLEQKIQPSAWFQKMYQTAPVEGSPFLIFSTAAGTTGAGFFRESRAMHPGHSRYIGYTMFETDRIPEAWVSAMDAMDEIWVPTKFNADTFAKSGVAREKIHVMPFGVDVSRFDPKVVTPLWPKPQSGVHFLSVFEWIWRKGWDVLLRAFVEEFQKSEDVSLTLVTHRGRGANLRDVRSVQERIDSFFRDELKLELTKLPKIHLIEERIPDDQWPNLYASYDAFVLPSRGEGWGLPYMEAMAMGLPVAGTAWGGSLEFLNSDNSYLIETEGLKSVPMEQIRDNPLFAGHRWAEPSVSSTRKVLREIFENPEQARQKGQQARQYVVENFTVEQAVDRIESRVCELQTQAEKAATSVDPEKPKQVYRFLWIGEDASLDGLGFLLACYRAVFEKDDSVSLTLAATNSSCLEAVQRTVASYKKLGGAKLDIHSVLATESERNKLYKEADAFVFPSRRDTESPLCSEALQFGLALVATEDSVAPGFRNESLSFSIPSLKFPAGEKTDRRIVCKAYPNVFGKIIRWVTKNPDKAKERGKTAAAKLAENTSKTNPVHKSIPLFAMGLNTLHDFGQFSRKNLKVTKEGGGLAGALNLEIERNGDEFLAVVVGSMPIPEQAIETLRQHPHAALYFEASSEGVFLLLRRQRARAFALFDDHFDEKLCLYEFVRTVRSEGGQILELDRYGLDSVPAEEKSVIAEFEKVEELVAKNQEERAIISLRHILNQKPDYPAALYLLSELLHKKNEGSLLDDSKDLLWQLCTLQPCHAKGRHLLGKLQFQEGDFSEAFEHLSFASRLDPENSVLWNDLGVVYAAKGDAKEALDSFRQAISLERASLDSAKNGADLLVSLGKAEEALQWLGEVIKKFPQDPELKMQFEALSVGVQE